MNNDSQLDSLLKQMAEDHRPQLPTPELIWWRAHILRKQQEQARVERPIKIMRMAAVVVCFVALAAMVIANPESFRALFAEGGWLLAGLGVVLVAASVISASVLRSSTRGR